MRFEPVVAVLVALAAAAPIQHGQPRDSYGNYLVYTPYQSYTPYPAAVDSEAAKMQRETVNAQGAEALMAGHEVESKTGLELGMAAKTE